MASGPRVRAGEVPVVNYATSSTTVSRVTANCRVRYDDGKVDDFVIVITSFTTDRSFSTNYPGTNVTTAANADHKILRDGTVESFIVQWRTSTSGTLKRGQFYVVAAIGDLSGNDFAGLAQGYVTSTHELQLGEQVEPGPGGGEGFIRTVTGTNPAANTEISETVPTGALWRLLSFSAVLVTDANVANRTTRLIIDDGTTANRRIAFGPSTTQAASLTRTWLFSAGMDVNATAAVNFTDTDSILTHTNFPFEKLGYLTAAYRIRSITANLQIGDDYAAPIFQVEEWIVK